MHLQTNDPIASDGAAARHSRLARLAMAGIVLLWLASTLPIVTGGRTLYLRDAFVIHLHLKAFGSAELTQGRVPATNPDWGLGQPFRGNPNALPLYPGNLLYLLLPFWSAFNLHFALHWLLAFLTAHALARALGQSPMAALLAALTYAGGGLLLSDLSFYNLIVVMAWWPMALTGAMRGGRAGLALGGLACGLALLGGDPLTALLGLVPMALLTRLRHGWLETSARMLVVGALGVLLALPQLVATARVMEFTVRAAVTSEGAGLPYWLHPVRLLELLLPLPFGRPDAVGGEGFLDGRLAPRLPFFFSIYHGLVALPLVVIAASRRRSVGLLAAAGLGLAMTPPAVADVLTRISGGLFRYPEKLLFWWALSAALLTGYGLDLLLHDSVLRRRAARLAAALAALCFVLALGLPLVAHRLVGWLATEAGSSERAAYSIARAQAWPLTATVSGLALLAVFFLIRWMGSGHTATRAAALALVGLQLLTLARLAPLFATDDTETYRNPSTLRAALPPRAATVSASYDSPFGESPPTYFLPDDSRFWLSRIGHADLDFPTGPLQDLTYPLAADLEGLTSPYLAQVRRALPMLDWPARINWLRTLGVDAVVLTQRPPPDGLIPMAALDRLGVPTALMRVAAPAPAAWWPATVTAVPDPQAAFRGVSRSHAPLQRVVTAAPVDHVPGATVQWVSSEPDRLVLDVEGEGGLLVVRRAFLPLWRGSSAGVSLPVQPVNLVLLGVTVPPGKQRVTLEISSRPELLAGFGSAFAIFLCAALWLSTPRRVRRHPFRHRRTS